MQPRQPNDFERALPMIGGTIGQWGGGILGGAGGVLGGAAIPGADLTGVPEVAGGVVGAKVGSTAGAAAGGALGQGAQDFLTHNVNGGTLGRIGMAGLENGIGGLIGDGLIKGGGAILHGIGGFLAGNAAKRATQVGTEAAAQGAAKAASEAEAQALAKANAYKNNYGSISDRLQRDLNLGTNAKTVDSLGFDSTDPLQMKHVSDAGHVLNSVYDNALKNAPDVSLKGFGNTIYADMQKNGITDLGTTPMGQALSKAGVDISQPDLTLPATQVRKLQQAVGEQIGNTQKLINNSELQGVSNTEANAQLGTLQNVYKDLGGKIKTPEVDKAIAGVQATPAGRQALTSQYGDTLGNHIADTISGAQSADHLLKPMQSFTQMSQAANMATNDIDNAVGTARAVARTKADLPVPAPTAAPMAGAGNGILDTLSLGAAPFTHGASLLGLIPHALGAISKPEVQDAALNGLSKFQQSNIATNILPALTKMGAIAAANVPNMAGKPQPNPEMSNPSNPSQQSTEGAGMQPSAPQLSPLEQFVLQQQSIQGNLAEQEQKAPLALQGLGGAAAGMTGSIGALMPQVQQQQQAAPVLSNLESSYANAGGAQGPIGGLMSQASALIPGSPAAQYQHSQQAAAATLAQLLHISPQEAMQLLPQLTNSSETAAGPQNAIHSLQGSIGPSSGASALAGL